MNYLNKKRTNKAATSLVPEQNPNLLKKGFTKLQKIIFDTKLNLENYSMWIFRCKYSVPDGTTTVRQFSFDGSLSYRECLCRIPKTLDLNTQIKLRKKRFVPLDSWAN